MSSNDIPTQTGFTTQQLLPLLAHFQKRRILTIIYSCLLWLPSLAGIIDFVDVQRVHTTVKEMKKLVHEKVLILSYSLFLSNLA